MSKLDSDLVTVCGWQAICRIMGIKDNRTAKKRLKAMGIKVESRTPILSVDLYRALLIKYHKRLAKRRQ